MILPSTIPYTFFFLTPENRSIIHFRGVLDERHNLREFSVDIEAKSVKVKIG
jgi:hypothetical protein